MELPAHDDADGWVAFIAAHGRSVRIEALMTALVEPTPLTGLAQEVVIKQIRARAKVIARKFIDRGSKLAAENVLDEAMHAVDLAIAQPESKRAGFCRRFFYTFVKHRVFTAYRKQPREQRLTKGAGDASGVAEGEAMEMDAVAQAYRDGVSDRDLERLRIEFQDMLESIPDPINRRATELRHQGYRWSDVAIELGETVGAVKWRVKKSLPPETDASGN